MTRYACFTVASFLALAVGLTGAEPPAPASQQPSRPPAPAPPGPAAAPAPTTGSVIAIVGGKVFPVSGPPIENGTVLITDGKISAVGADVSVPAGARTIDAKGKWVTPGLVSAATALGIVEVGAVADTNDARAKGTDGIAAAFRAWDGLNPGSVLWAPTANEGVTHVVVLPSGGLVSGQGAFLETLQGPRDEMIRRAPIAMVANLGTPDTEQTSARGEMLQRMRELLEDARVYATRKAAYDAGGTRKLMAGRLDLEALGPVLAGKVPLLVSADKAGDIEAALDLSAEYKLRLIVLGGAEAWRIAPRLASARVPVVTTALDNIPSSFETLGVRQENAALLRSAGVEVAIVAGEGETFNVRNIRQHAGNAVAYGLSWDDALRAVTLVPSEIFGMAATIGSLQPGRDANVVVWDGDPFEMTTSAVQVLVRGRDARTVSRQDLLTERYKAPGRTR